MQQTKLLKIKKIAISFSFICVIFANDLISCIFASTKNSNIDSKTELLNSSNQGFQLGNDIYIVGPGDLLNIKFRIVDDVSQFNNFKELNSGIKAKVLNDGTISIPYAGVVNVNGMTLNQSKYHIEEILKKELLLPRVEISILKPRPVSISVIGEVERPGLYQIDKDLINSDNQSNLNNDFSNPTVINAIQAAGGITGKADLKKVIIKRKLPGNLNNYKQAKLNFVDLIFKGDQSQNLYLFDGDIIILKQVKKAIDKDATEILAANLAPENISITVTGEVVNPGQLYVKSGTPLIQGIFKAGGPKNWRASYGNADLLRLNRNGSVSHNRYRISLREEVSGIKNPQLKNGDIIKVGRSNLAKTSDAIGAISKPVGGVLTIWSMFKLIED